MLSIILVLVQLKRNYKHNKYGEIMANEFWAVIGAREYRKNYDSLNKKERTFEEDMQIIKRVDKLHKIHIKWLTQDVVEIEETEE